MEAKRVIAVASAAALLLVASGVAAADSEFKQVADTQITPANPTSFDIGWVDQAMEAYYLADRTNKTIDVLNARTDQLVKSLAAGRFVGNTGNSDTSGPDGVVVVGNEVWAGDGDSTVKVIALPSGDVTHTISTGGSKRADELAYDPQDHLILIANDADSPPFVTAISTVTYAVVGHLSFPDATDGLEQPIWDPANGMFYQNVPEVGDKTGVGEVAEINPKTLQIVSKFPVFGCFPAGLALGPRQELLLGCSGDAIAAGYAPESIIMSATNGEIIAGISEVGGSDEVWYNPHTQQYYLAAGSMVDKAGQPMPVLGVVNAESHHWVENIPTAKSAHSVAANENNGQVFVPTPGKGIRVYTRTPNRT